MIKPEYFVKSNDFPGGQFQIWARYWYKEEFREAKIGLYDLTSPDSMLQAQIDMENHTAFLSAVIDQPKQKKSC